MPFAGWTLAIVEVVLEGLVPWLGDRSSEVAVPMLLRFDWFGAIVVG